MTDDRTVLFDQTTKKNNYKHSIIIVYNKCRIMETIYTTTQSNMPNSSSTNWMHIPLKQFNMKKLITLFLIVFVAFSIKAQTGTNWQIQYPGFDNQWRSVAYGNGLFVAVAEDGSGNRVMTSPDGINWTIRTSAADNNWFSVTYGNGLFVAVANTGTGNRVMTSPDGITWTIRTSAADNSWNSVTYGNGLFVAVAKSGFVNRVMTSPDGITWTSRKSAADNSWNSVTYGNGLFVAVATSGIGNRVMTSPDGISWTSRTSVADNYWNSVTYGNGLFVAVSSFNTVMTSPDGITWTSRTPAANNVWNSVTYGNGLFVAVASSGSGNRVMTSPDGITWTSRSTPDDNSWYSVTYGNGLFVAVAIDGSGYRVATSPNGITWTRRASAADNNWFSVTYGNGLFVAVARSGTGNRVMTSPDGITWTGRTSAADNNWNSVAYGNGLFVAVAISGTGNRVMTSPNGITWTGRTSAADNQWNSVTYGNGLFVATAISGVCNRVMTSGINTWTGTVSTDWNTAGNWIANAVPTANDPVYISTSSNNPIINQAVVTPALCKYLSTKAGTTLSINAGKALTVSGDIMNNGTITLKSDATGTATLLNTSTISGSGTYNVEQYLTGSGGSTPNGRFWYIASPITNATSATLDAVGDNIVKKYSETTHAWVELTDNVTTLPIGTGYFARLGATTKATFTGSLNTGDITLSPSRSGTSDAKRGFNLVGNPYPSFIDWELATKTNLDPTMWYRTYNGTAMVFDTYNATSHIGTNNNLSGEVTKYIPPMQAFWVRVDADGSAGNLGFTNAIRSHQSGNLLKVDAMNDLIRLKVSNAINSDETILVFNSEAQNSLDDFDSEKMFASDSTIPELYTVAGISKLTINGLQSAASNPEIALGFKTATAGKFTITANQIEGLLGVPVVLEDKLLNKTQDLTQTPTYSFSSDVTDNTSRFALRLKAETTDVNEVGQLVISIFEKGKSIVVETNETSGTISISDVSGRIIKTQTISETQTIIPVSAGVYFVKVLTEKALDTKEIIVQ